MHEMLSIFVFISGVNASLTLGGRPSPCLLPLPSTPYPSPPSPPLPLEVGPLDPARGSGGALLAPPARSGAELQPKSNLVHFSLKIRHLVATILMIFLRVLPEIFLWPHYSAPQELGAH